MVRHQSRENQEGTQGLSECQRRWQSSCKHTGRTTSSPGERTGREIQYPCKSGTSRSRRAHVVAWGQPISRDGTSERGAKPKCCDDASHSHSPPTANAASVKLTPTESGPMRPAASPSPSARPV